MPLTLAVAGSSGDCLDAISQPRPDRDRCAASRQREQRPGARGDIALQTWRFFTTHVTAEHHHLPPDNFQETPAARSSPGRTSPTNIGLYLLVVATARKAAAGARAAKRSTASKRRLRHAPHAYRAFAVICINWYDTRDLRVLEPAYVSAVDSGNLAGHLIALANLLDGLETTPTVPAPCCATRRRSACDGDSDGFSLSSIDPGPAAAVDRLVGGRQPPRRELLRPAGVGGSAGESVCHRQGRCAGPPLVPPRAAARLPAGGASILISWSGSMFEYLMPSLLMRAPDGSLLETSNRLVVQRQRDYAGEAGVPWGISESAYNARDREMTYQYSNFGVPGLGLEARTVRKSGDRALCDRPGSDGRCRGGAGQSGSARSHRRARRIRLL